MSKKMVVAIFLTAIFAAGTLAFAGGPKPRIPSEKGSNLKPYAEGEVIVKFKKGVSPNAVESLAGGLSLKIKKQFKTLTKMKGNQYTLFKSSEILDAEILAQKLRSNASVESATPNYLYRVYATPNDTYYANYLWGMNNTGQTGGTVDADIDAPEAWDITTGSSNIIVAVIDTGLDYLHPDLSANVWTNSGEIAGNGVDDDGNGYIDDKYGIDAAGWNGSTPDRDPMDGYGHGTHCAGTIGAVGNNARGVVGVNWNVKIMGLKFMDDDGGSGYNAFAIECIEYVIDQKLNRGQNVVAINASWGGHFWFPRGRSMRRH